MQSAFSIREACQPPRMIAAISARSRKRLPDGRRGDGSNVDNERTQHSDLQRLGQIRKVRHQQIVELGEDNPQYPTVAGRSDDQQALAVLRLSIAQECIGCVGAASQAKSSCASSFGLPGCAARLATHSLAERTSMVAGRMLVTPSSPPPRQIWFFSLSCLRLSFRPKLYARLVLQADTVVPKDLLSPAPVHAIPPCMNRKAKAVDDFAHKALVPLLERLRHGHNVLPFMEPMIPAD